MKFFAIGLWAIAAVATGYTLFYITFQVEELEAELTQLNQDILEEQEAVHVLKAEWSYLNRPDRLETLSARLLPNLQGLSVGQITKLEDLPDRPVEIEEGDVIGAIIADQPDAIPVSTGGAQ